MAGGGATAGGGQESRAPERVSAGDLDAKLGEFKERPTYPEFKCVQYVGCLLAVICTLVFLLGIGWFFTRPDYADVARALGEAPEGAVVADVLRALQEQHLAQFRDMFQLLVLGGLVPLFTLLAGYVFGSRERSAGSGGEDEAA